MMEEISTLKSKQFLTWRDFINWLSETGKTTGFFGLIVIRCIVETVIQRPKSYL